MLRLNLLFTVSFAVVSIAFITGCANNTDYSGSGITQVVEIDSNDSTIELGDGSVFKIDGSSRNRVGNCTYFCANYRLFSEG